MPKFPQGLVLNVTPHLVLAFVAATWLSSETTAYMLLTMALYIVLGLLLQVLSVRVLSRGKFIHLFAF